MKIRKLNESQMNYDHFITELNIIWQNAGDIFSDSFASQSEMDFRYRTSELYDLEDAYKLITERVKDANYNSVLRLARRTIGIPQFDMAFQKFVEDSENGKFDDMI